MSYIKNRLKQYKDKYSKYSKHDGVYVEDVLVMLEQLQEDLEQDEKENGLAWTEECGSTAGEKVHAWMPMEDIEIADLPENVERRN